MNLQIGDILFCKGHKWYSKTIAAVTRSRFSHVALYIELWGRPTIIDAQANGVNPKYFELWDEKYGYDYEIYRPPYSIDEKELCLKALSKSGITFYDFESLLFRQPKLLLTGDWKKRKKENDTMYCSEYVAWVLGYDLNYRMSPQDLYTEISRDRFQFVYANFSNHE